MTDNRNQQRVRKPSRHGDGSGARRRVRVIPTPGQLLERARRRNTGDAGWRRWKEQSARELIELFGATDRAKLLDLSFEGDLNVAYRMRMPVPRWPQGEKLKIAHEAIFHLNYRENWRYEAPAGWEPLGLFSPLDVFHSNCQPSLRGAICLGALPPGVSPKELVLMGYYALTLQDVTLDETDPQGILNPMACEFYRNHPEHLPLTWAGFLDPWDPNELSEVTE